MRAIVQNAYGGPEVFGLKDVEQPQIDRDDQILIRVCAASLNAGDVFGMKGSPWVARFTVGFPKPKDHIPGWDMAGVVEAVGKDVTTLQAGDEVYASGHHALAEYAIAPAHQVATKPANLTFLQAAAVPTAGVVALQELRAAGKLKTGRRILINGASGGVGTFAVQIAKAFETEVTAVCSTRHIELVRSLGADDVVDYTQDDFTCSRSGYDLVLDNVGSHPFSALRRALTADGIIQPNTGHAGMGYVFKAFALAPFMRHIGRMFVVMPKREDLMELKELIESGKVTPVVDRTFAMADASDAFAYIAEGHARGKVVIKIQE